jgi:hypothetical protein
MELEEQIRGRIDAVEGTAKLEMIDGLLSVLQFEKRMALLTPRQREAMEAQCAPSMSSYEVAAFDKADEDRRKTILADAARTVYIRRCAWADYLNGVSKTPPAAP